MEELLEYLKIDEYANVYILRGLIQGIKDFRYEVSRNGANHIDGIAARWEAEKGATVRGNPTLCSKWFDRLYGQYSLYELDESFAEQKLKESEGKPLEGAITYNLIMVYKPEEQVIREKYIDYKSIDKDEWYKISNTFKEKYGKEFIEFEPANMEWLCVYKEKEAIATICIEKVNQDLGMISSVYVIPDLRQQGIGTRLLKTVLRDYREQRFMLFVDQENTEAIKLYEKMGFKVYKRVVNIEVVGP